MWQIFGKSKCFCIWMAHASMISYPCLCDFVLMLVWFCTHACVISYSCLYDFALVLVWFRTHACMISYSCLYDFVLCHWKANRQLPFSPMITSTISKICRMNKKLNFWNTSYIPGSYKNAYLISLQQRVIL